VQGCPVGIDIPAFIKLILEDKRKQALLKIKEMNNLPAICGRVCPQEDQCEKVCILNKKGMPINIGALERYASDYELNQPLSEYRASRIKNREKVAVAGSGPAGLTAAADLAKIGYQVLLFESLHIAGGVLTYGIPEFRLPKIIVQKELEYIKSLGVELNTDVLVGRTLTIADLFDQGISAIFLAVGAGLPQFLGIPGENLGRVYSANEFLTRINLMKAYKFPEYATPINIGKSRNGYLYVILGGEQYDSAISMVADSYIIRTSTVALMVNFFIAALVGLLLFFLLTRRLRQVIGAVRHFEQGDHTIRIGLRSRDEIGQLSDAFNKMADTIDRNIEEIKRNDQMRRDLIANISHDLRSPLASVQGYLETIMIKNAELGPDQRYDYLQTADKNIQRLNRLVSELLELSRLDAGQVTPDRERFNLGELVQDVIQKFQPQADRKKISLASKFLQNVKPVSADIGMIDRAISNLIENALTYTPENGKVIVELIEDESVVYVKVSDDGPGIEPEDIPHIFDRFFRGDKSRTTEGTGLGLAITKKIVEAHDSDITVSSRTGRGTSFRFSLSKAALT